MIRTSLLALATVCAVCRLFHSRSHHPPEKTFRRQTFKEAPGSHYRGYANTGRTGLAIIAPVAEAASHFFPEFLHFIQDIRSHLLLFLVKTKNLFYFTDPFYTGDCHYIRKLKEIPETNSGIIHHPACQRLHCYETHIMCPADR